MDYRIIGEIVQNPLFYLYWQQSYHFNQNKWGSTRNLEEQLSHSLTFAPSLLSYFFPFLLPHTLFLTVFPSSLSLSLSLSPTLHHFLFLILHLIILSFLGGGVFARCLSSGCLPDACPDGACPKAVHGRFTRHPSFRWPGLFAAHSWGGVSRCPETVLQEWPKTGSSRITASECCLSTFCSYLIFFCFISFS